MLLKKTLMFFLLVSALKISVVWATPSFETVVNAIQANYQKTNDWSAEFIQSTYVEMLAQEVIKKGIISVKKPGKLFIKYQDDSPKTYISNGQKLWVYTEGDQEVTVFKKISKQLASEALTFMNGLGDLKKDFEVLSFDKADLGVAMMKNKNLSYIELVPRDTESTLDRVVLGVDANLVMEVTLFNSSKNKTHYVFTNIKCNTNPPESQFEFGKREGIKEVSY